MCHYSALVCHMLRHSVSRVLKCSGNKDYGLFRAPDALVVLKSLLCPSVDHGVNIEGPISTLRLRQRI